MQLFFLFEILKGSIHTVSIFGFLHQQIEFNFIVPKAYWEENNCTRESESVSVGLAESSDCDSELWWSDKQVLVS